MLFIIKYSDNIIHHDFSSDSSSLHTPESIIHTKHRKTVFFKCTFILVVMVNRKAFRSEQIVTKKKTIDLIDFINYSMLFNNLFSGLFYSIFKTR